MFRTRIALSQSRVVLVLAVALMLSLVAHVVRTAGPAVEGSSERAAGAAAGFLSARIGTVMGSSTLDLRETTIVPGEQAVVTLFVVMGRVTVRVPEGWEVDTAALPAISRVEDTRRPAAGVEAAGPAPRLVLRGVVMLGTVDVAS